MDFCRVPGAAYAGCYGYRANSIGALAQSALGVVERARFILNSLVATSSYLSRVRHVLGHHAVSRVGPLAVLPALQRLESDLRRAQPGQAYFAHLLIPHYPYVLDERCAVRGSIEEWLYNGADQAAAEPNTDAQRAERYRRYFAQLRCQQILLGRLFDALRQAGAWRDAIVVVHGDHGSRIVRRMPLAENAARLTPQDLRDGFSTLFALRAPGVAAGVAREPRPLQALLAEAVGFPAPAFEPRLYLRSADNLSLTPFPLGTGPALRSPGGR
jgi:hypothetical protein